MAHCYSFNSISIILVLHIYSFYLFRTSPAENIPAEPGTVQIVSAVQACHWFDLPVFFKEVDRVLCNNGIVALTGYDMPTIVHPMKSEQLNQLIDSVRILHCKSSGNLFSNIRSSIRWKTSSQRSGYHIQ